MGTVKYWWRVRSRAWKGAKEALGHNRTKSVIGGIVTFLAIAIFGAAEGGTQAWAKAEWWLACLGGVSCVYILVFIYQLFHAPRHMEDEAADESHKRMTELRKQYDMVQASIQETKEEVRTLAAKKDAEIRLRHDENAKLVDKIAILEQPPSKLRQELEKLREFIARANAIIALAVAATNDDELANDLSVKCSEWLTEVKKFFLDSTNFTSDMQNYLEQARQYKPPEQNGPANLQFHRRQMFVRHVQGIWKNMLIGILEQIEKKYRGKA